MPFLSHIFVSFFFHMNTDVEHSLTGCLYRPSHGNTLGTDIKGVGEKIWGWGCQEFPTLYEHSGTMVASTNTIIQICHIPVCSLNVLSWIKSLFVHQYIYFAVHLYAVHWIFNPTCTTSACLYALSSGKIWWSI